MKDQDKDKENKALVELLSFSTKDVDSGRVKASEKFKADLIASRNNK